MLTENDLHEYQKFAVRQMVDNPVMMEDGAGMFIDLGLGKTISTLTAINELMFERFEVSKVLVIAPKMVAEHTWDTEIHKWKHVSHLKISKVLGTEKERLAALKRKADIYVINRENVPWLVSHYGLAFPFDMLVIDELSSFKSPKAQRFKALKLIRPKIQRVIGLTATPAPNGMQDLWSQIFLLDRGKRLGKTITEYRSKYFTRNPYTPFVNFELKSEKDSLVGEDYYQKKIFEKVSDICVSMQAKDWLDMPERIDTTQEIALPTSIQAEYDKFEREQVFMFAEDEKDEISAPNAAALIGKLLQFSNGAVYYDQQRNYHEIHNEKINRLGEMLEAANGNPVLVVYQFQSDVDRICKHLKEFKPQHIKDVKDVVRKWNEKKLPVLLGHAASMGHGLNMQQGGNQIIHFGVGWALELYQQVVARLHRQGQIKSVVNTRIICPSTYETNVLNRLESKADNQESLLQAVKALVQKHRN